MLAFVTLYFVSVRWLGSGGASSLDSPVKLSLTNLLLFFLSLVLLVFGDCSPRIGLLPELCRTVVLPALGVDCIQTDPSLADAFWRDGPAQLKRVVRRHGA